MLETEEYQEKMIRSSFLYLTLDLPSAPLYKDEMEHNIIPQIPLATLLAKFNGMTEKVRVLPLLSYNMVATYKYKRTDQLEKRN